MVDSTEEHDISQRLTGEVLHGLEPSRDIDGLAEKMIEFFEDLTKDHPKKDEFCVAILIDTNNEGGMVFHGVNDDVEQADRLLTHAAAVLKANGIRLMVRAELIEEGT